MEFTANEFRGILRLLKGHLRQNVMIDKVWKGNRSNMCYIFSRIFHECHVQMYQGILLFDLDEKWQELNRNPCPFGKSVTY